jgi:uncharacterized protein YdaU (DUF1376 family)
MTSPAFQFYAQDFLVGTAEMLPEEVGGYIRLLSYQWVKGGVPTDRRKLMQLTGILDSAVLDNVLQKFQPSSDNSGLLVNVRLETVRQQQLEHKQKQGNNGSKGGNPNFKKGHRNPYYNQTPNPVDNLQDNPEHNPLDNPTDNPQDKQKITSSTSSSISNNITLGLSDDNASDSFELGTTNEEEQKRLRKEKADFKARSDERFILFWKEYGKYAGKQQSKTNWGKLTEAEQLAAIAYIPTYKLKQPDKTFRKDPERYMSKKLWLDLEPGEEVTEAPQKYVPNQQQEMTAEEVNDLFAMKPDTEVYTPKFKFST